MEYSYFEAMTNHCQAVILDNEAKIITRLSFKKMQPFDELILDALTQSRTEGYVMKFEARIMWESLSLKKDDLLEFLYNQISNT